MKEKIDNIREFLGEFSNRINTIDLTELQEEEFMVSINKIEDLAEELEFLSEELE